jgi:hypothetical protein
MLEIRRMSVSCNISATALEEALNLIGQEAIEDNPTIELRVCPEEMFNAARALKRLSSDIERDGGKLSLYSLVLRNASIITWYHIRSKKTISPWELRCGDIIVRSEGA